MRHALIRVGLVVAVVVLIGMPASAQDSSEDPKGRWWEQRFSLGIGGASTRFSTTYEEIRRDEGLRFFVSLEGDLGFPASETVPQFDLLVRIGKKSYISVDINRFNRSKTLLDLQSSIHIGDLEIHAGADVDAWFNVSDFDISYGHSYYERENVRIIAKFGLYVMDLDAGVRAEGDFTLGDVAFTGTYEIGTSLIIPVPLVGVIFDFDISKRWTFMGSVEFMYLPVSDITAEALRTRIYMRYAFSRTVGVTFGVSHFGIEVIEDKNDTESTIAYTMNGVYGGLSFRF